jgi:GNAT superfamily N-acetyltransferase
VELAIRIADERDIAHLVRQRRAMFSDAGVGSETDLNLMSEAVEAYFRQAIADGSYRAYLALDSKGTVVAGAGIALPILPPSPDNLNSRRAMILNVYTEPQWRRRGIARKLMLVMIEWCRQQGFGYVDLHATTDGRALYEQLGFIPTSEMRLRLR